MFNKSRKKSIFKNEKKREQKALSNFDTKEEKDEFIIKDLGVNKESKKEIKKVNLKLFAIAFFIIVLLATALFSIKLIKLNAYEMIWKSSVTKGSDDINNKSVKYELFNNGLMRISNDGITYINDKGEVRWTISYNMKMPIYECNGKYFVVADKNGFEFYIFDEKGKTGENVVTNPIQKISMSADGIVYILQNDENSSYINLFRHNGNEIDITIKSTLTGDGMPIDISASEDGTELVVAYASLTNDNIFTKAVYYNFDTPGKYSNSKRIVGEFVDEFKGKFLARAHFFDNKNSCLIYDGGVYFVSTSDLSNPVITKKYEFDNMIRSISLNNEILAMSFEDGKLIIFEKDGKQIANKQIDFDYEKFYVSQDYIIYIYDNKVSIFDKRGRMIFDKEMNIDIQYVAKKKSLIFTELLVGLIDGVELLRFY